MSHLIFSGLRSVTGRYPFLWSQPVSILPVTGASPVGVGSSGRWWEHSLGRSAWSRPGCHQWRLGHGCSKTAAALRSMRLGRFGRASGCQTLKCNLVIVLVLGSCGTLAL